MKFLRVTIPASSFVVRKSFLIVSIFSFCVCLSVFFSVRNITAFSMSDYSISFEVADYGLRLYVEKFQSASPSSFVRTFGSCSGGIFSGNYFTLGKYEVSFYDSGGNMLDCNKPASEVAFIRSRGFYRGTSTVVQRWYGHAFYCTGSRPANTTPYQNDATDLKANTPWTYSATNTEKKCQYECSNGFSWNGINCNSTGSTPPPPPSTPPPSTSFNPLDPATNVALIATHHDDETLWFEPWLHIADKVLTPSVYPTSDYMQQHIGFKYMSSDQWVSPQGKTDHNTAKMIAHDRDYRLVNITNEYLASILDAYVKNNDVIVTHSPWGEYGHEQHRQIFCVVQGLAQKYGKDVYVWNGSPNEVDHMGGMPNTFFSLGKNGKELPKVSLSFNRSNYDAIRNIFIQAEYDYPMQPGEMWWNNRFWTWDRTWEGTYGTYNPPTTAIYYKVMERGVVLYDPNQIKSLSNSVPIYPDGGIRYACF